MRITRGLVFYPKNCPVQGFTIRPFGINMAQPMMKAKVMKIQEQTVTLQLPDGQLLALPSKSVEGECKPGQEVAIVAAVLGAEDAGRQALARHLLNELLKG